MIRDIDIFVSSIVDLVKGFTKSQLDQFMQDLQSVADTDDRERLMTLIAYHPNFSIRQKLKHITDLWFSEYSELSIRAVLLAIKTTINMHDQLLEEHKSELVWTGPKVERYSFRRLDQVLLDIIEEAKEYLIIVSFAVYKIPEVHSSLVRAAKRGVKIKLLLETKDSSDGKIKINGFSELREELYRGVDFFIWPLEMRNKDANGNYGSLHAKFVVVDDRTILISSANLTGYAHNLNMELGICMHNMKMAKDLRYSLEELEFNRIITKVIV